MYCQAMKADEKQTAQTTNVMETSAVLAREGETTETHCASVSHGGT